MRFAQGLGYLGPLPRPVMLDELQALGLLGLIVCQYFLIRGCFKINETIPQAGGSISAKIDRTADLLDEVAQLISDFGDAVSTPPVAQPPSGIGDLLTMFLNNRTNMPHTDSDATQKQEWEIYPPNENPPPVEA